LSWPAAIASLAVGALATAILVVNNLRDRHTDAEANKRTLAVRFGAGFARGEYATLVFGAYALVALVWASELGGVGWFLPWLSLPLAVTEYQAICNNDGAELNPHLGRTGRLCIVFSLLLTLGVQL
jgi:1,4-dihydroxy-2-naphthoate octaprenyltransferase